MRFIASKITEQRRRLADYLRRYVQHRDEDGRKLGDRYVGNGPAQDWAGHFGNQTAMKKVRGQGKGGVARAPKGKTLLHGQKAGSRPPPVRLERGRQQFAREHQRLKEAQEEARLRAAECEEVKEHLEAAFRGAQMHAFSQDLDLRYTWASASPGDKVRAALVGRTDDEIWSSAEQRAVISAKRRVLTTGIAEDCETSWITPQHGGLFALHIDPVFAADRSITGVMCTAFDVSRIRSLESEHRRLADEFAANMQRYEFGLRGSKVTVFTQDRELRYTSVSKPMYGRDQADMLGKTDRELLAGAQADAISALKQSVLDSGVSENVEFSLDDRGAAVWHDLHIEPIRDPSGDVIGLTGAAVDITERKEGEAHLRLLMRELTHRSKNLLAVIQAMARQTGRHAGTVDEFLERFNARVQALARSHDLLVAESWHGASLSDLVRSQLAYYVDDDSRQVSIVGPDIQLKPEATQSLGLALHELATNASKHGALSKAEGHIEISWQYLAGDGGVELLWRETQGPTVSAPKRRGFGTLVIEQNLPRALDAEVRLDFAAEGLTVRVAVPKTQLAGRG